jgi:CRP-like cAMP-binding protein
MNELNGNSVKTDPRTNLLLASMLKDDYDALISHATAVTLKLKKRLLRQDEHNDAVYFPLTCMISLLVTARDKPQMEMATIGKEGVIGAAEALQKQGSIGMKLIQIPGVALRVDTAKLLALAASRPHLQWLIHQHTYALLRQILYGAACNRQHNMEERCARWLLMTNDRAGHDTFPITQEFLSHMLGVRRMTVNVATAMLKKAGFIRYVRGIVTITDRPGLESASCECYHAINKVYADCFPTVQPKGLTTPAR